MPRGGRRQGTPGKGYANRTDLQQAPDMAQNTAGTGGMQGPPIANLPAPEDTPNLFDPTQRPDEPVTAGLPIGPGAGPATDTRLQETQQMQRYLPILRAYLDQPDVPDSVRALYRYIRGA